MLLTTATTATDTNSDMRIVVLPTTHP
jgi:hypothetical protein